jgi:hypothetical protein
MKEEIKLQENIPQTAKEAAKTFIENNNVDIAVQFLRKNPNEATEFCYQVFESYQKSDKTGLVLLSKIIKGLL